jgi:hypothetical protein
LNTTAGIENAFETSAARLDGRNDIVKNFVHHVFVKNALVAVRKEILLEALEFKAGFVGNVQEVKLGEVR